MSLNRFSLDAARQSHNNIRAILKSSLTNGTLCL